MLDLFENGNFRRRRRRRRNLSLGFREPSEPFSPMDPQQNATVRSLHPDSFCPESSSHRVDQRNPPISKPESEIKFSIDYILSTPDPSPGFRPPHGGSAGAVIQHLEPQQLNLHFWTLWPKHSKKLGEFNKILQNFLKVWCKLVGIILWWLLGQINLLTQCRYREFSLDKHSWYSGLLFFLFVS